MSYKMQTAALIASLLFSTVCYAEIKGETSAPVKTYMLSDLREAVSNSDKCEASLASLKQMAEKPISLKFALPSAQGQRTVEHTGAQLLNHGHATLKQNVTDNLVYRVGTGSFELNKQTIEYVIQIAADLQNDQFKYVYPITLATNDAHCFITGLVTPDEQTVAAFKKNLSSGAVAKKTDLHQK